MFAQPPIVTCWHQVLCDAYDTMGKQSRKRQKTSKEDNIQPLGSHAFVDDTTKDDEERRLESMLFGVPYVPSEKSKGRRRGDDAGIVVISDAEDEAVAEGNLKELENMLDSDVCGLFLMN